MIELNKLQKSECHAAADTLVNYLRSIGVRIEHDNIHAVHSGIRYTMYNLSANIIRYNVDPNSKVVDDEGST